MSHLRVCQSCGLPFDETHSCLIAKETDGSESIYCVYCYKDGQFTNPQLTLEEAIEIGIPHLARKIGTENARKELSELLPRLDRWRTK